MYPEARLHASPYAPRTVIHAASSWLSSYLETSVTLMQSEFLADIRPLLCNSYCDGTPEV